MNTHRLSYEGNVMDVIELIWSVPGQMWIVNSSEVNMAALTKADARRMFKPGTVLHFIGQGA